MRVPLIAGNRKMYKTTSEAIALVKALHEGLGTLTDREVLVCPPYTAIASVTSTLGDSPIMVGAQDVFYKDEGAFTGAISPVMLRDLGCTYTLVGHSERRQVFGEDDAIINLKLHAGLKHGLKVIVCVGELKAQRDAGQAEAVVVSQLRGSLANITVEQMAEIVIAYEPVWAIGTGDTATPADAQAMHATVRTTLADLFGTTVADATRIQYGGSVKPDNVDELMGQPDIDGALVGGAALKADSFLRIIQYK